MDLAVPIIDVSSLISGEGDRHAVASLLRQACRDAGFFYVVGHGIDLGLQQRLEALSREFFALDSSTKMQIAMAKGGRAWRGYFPVGEELTSGLPDIKEGLYFGSELEPDHPDVKAGLPLHGANQFPANPPEFAAVVLEYMHVMTQLGHALMSGLALSLQLDQGYFYDHYTAEPLILFRIFNYPPPESNASLQASWGVGEHTDYGLLTILKQDDCGGLEVKSRAGWVEAPPISNAFVCNIGDMLEIITGGLYRSTPHRVRNVSGRFRMSWPFFFDPNFRAPMKEIKLPPSLVAGDTDSPAVDATGRWDQADLHAFQGTYGDYLLSKVGKVFPHLRATTRLT